jgi:hypothetical protein
MAFVLKETWMKTVSAVFAASCFLAAAFLVWKREREQAESLSARFRGLPLLRLVPGGFYGDIRTLGIRRVTSGGESAVDTQPLSSIHVRFINDPLVPTPEGAARGVIATIEFQDMRGGALFQLDGRWGDTDQPLPGSPTVQLLSVDFQIGQTRELDIAMKLPRDADCHGINNDSYRAPNLKDARWRLVGPEFYAIVRLRGAYVDRRWRLHFRNPGAGSALEALDAEELDS